MLLEDVQHMLASEEAFRNAVGRFVRVDGDIPVDVVGYSQGSPGEAIANLKAQQQHHFTPSCSAKKVNISSRTLTRSDPKRNLEKVMDGFEDRGVIGLGLGLVG